MKIIDNRDFLISEIDSKTNSKIKELEKEYKKQLTTLESDIKSKTKEETSSMRESHKKLKERIKKQEESSFALYKEKSIIRAQSKVQLKVMEKVKSAILSKSKEKFFGKLIKEIDSVSDKKIKHYIVPKGVKVKGKKCVEELSEVGVIGVIDAREEIELTLKNLLEKNSVAINKIMGELF